MGNCTPVDQDPDNFDYETCYKPWTPSPCGWKWTGLILRNLVMGLNVTSRTYFAFKAAYRYYKTYDTAL